MKIGRNDPCPCGSGKKYKRCCGSGGSAARIIPFPGVEEVGFESGGLDRSRPDPGFSTHDDPPTFMESLGTPNQATDFLHEMRTAMGDRKFASRDEIQSFMDTYIETRQHTPLDDFLGISPYLMHRILSGDRAIYGDFISLKKGLAVSDLEASPLLENAVYILRALEPGPLKTTSAGYFPAPLVRTWWESVAPRRVPDELLRKLLHVRKEADAWEFLECRLQLMSAGLIELAGGHFSLTPEGLRVIGTKDLDALFGYLLLAIGWTWDWETIRDDFRTFHPLTRRSFPFTLHLLSRVARDWVSQKGLVEVYLRAFPILLKEFPEADEYGTLSRDLDLGLGIIYWPHCLGLLEARRGFGGTEPDKDTMRPEEYRLSPLFDRLIQITVG